MTKGKSALVRGGLALAGAAVAVATAYALWWRKNPSACPYSQRFFLEVPHPFLRVHAALPREAGRSRAT